MIASSPVIVGLGVCCEDRLALTPRWPQRDEGVHLLDYSRQCGGMVATALAAASRLEISTAFIGMAGADPSGRWLKRQLADQGVDVSQFILRRGFPTPFSTVLVQKRTGQRRIFHYRPVDFDLGAEDVDFSAVSKAKFLHLDGHHLPLACRAADLARRHRVKVCLDASFPYRNMEDLLPRVDYLICGRHFPRQMTGKSDPRAALLDLAAYGPKMVAVTLGRQGGLFLWKGQFEHFPAFNVATVDTTGAGDVFHGAFLAALAKGRPVRKALQYASAAAALSCRALGGQAALPSHAETLAFLTGSRR